MSKSKAEKKSPVFLHLFHGRPTPETELDDWGSDGPLLGPFSWVHMTYASDIKCGDIDVNGDSIIELQYVEDLVYYDGIYYGDASVMATPSPGELKALASPDPWLARLPSTYETAGYRDGLNIRKEKLEYGDKIDAERRIHAIVLLGNESGLDDFWVRCVETWTNGRVKIYQDGYMWKVETAAETWDYVPGMRIRDDGKGWLDA